MIPSFNASGVLPPYTGRDSTDITFVSPYKATMLEVASHFATSVERRAILRGLLAYRAALQAVGIDDGYQWLNGSFCSDIERLETRSPDDIDVVTYARIPSYVVGKEDLKIFIGNNLSLLDPMLTKAEYRVDAYFINLDMKPHLLIERAPYWHGVFGHQRVTFLWKGMVRVELSCNDQAAMQHLSDLDARDAGIAIPGAAAGPLTGEGSSNA